MFFGFAKIFLFGFVLYHVMVVNEASLAQVSSIASSVVQQALPAHLAARAFGENVRVLRAKRSIVSKEYEDPDRCVHSCDSNQTDSVVNATVIHMMRLVSIVLRNITASLTTEDILSGSTGEDEKFNQRVEAVTIDNMGPLFDDLCSISQNAYKCIKSCPKSQLQDVALIFYEDTEALCEPSKNWPSFTTFWAAINCTNNTQAEEPCNNKCGPEKNITEVARLKLDLSGDVASLRYDNDVTTGNVLASACQSISCHIDCYKPIITERCGAKAYDMYARAAKIEAHSSLTVLKKVDATKSTVAECKQYQ